MILIPTPADWYYLGFPRDQRLIKYIILLVYLLETAQTIIMTNDCWHKYIKGFGDPERISLLQNEWLAVPFFTAISTFC